jgi:hypothetical protein
VVDNVSNPVPAGFDALPVLDLRDPNFTIEGNRILAELRGQRTGLPRGTPRLARVPAIVTRFFLLPSGQKAKRCWSASRADRAA